MLYNPLVIFPVAAVFPLLKGNRYNAWATLLIMTIATYLFGSWVCWWFGGAYGQRSYVELYPLLAAPMTFLWVKMLDSRHCFLKVGFTQLIVLLCFINMRMTVMPHPFWGEDSWTLDMFLRVIPECFFMKAGW